jgi:dCTP deaminase
MTFLGHDRILSMLEADPALFKEGTGDRGCIQQASYDLRLGEDAYLVGADAPIRLTLDRMEHLTIAPGQFALLMSHEILDLPADLIGFITLRNRFKLQGLVNISGFHVDPTFQGRLVFAVNNVGPNDIRLRYRERTFTIAFARVEGDVGKSREPFGNRLPLEYVQSLGGSSITLTRLQKDIDELRTRVLIYAPIGVALLTALLLNFLRK